MARRKNMVEVPEEVVEETTEIKEEIKPKVKATKKEVDVPVAEEAVEEVSEVKSEPEVEEKPVEEKPKAKIVKDKFEESKKVDANKSYDDVIATLKDRSLTNDAKLEKIYNTANVTYKAFIDGFYEFDNKVYNNQAIRSNSKLFNEERNKLWANIKKGLDTKDAYVRNAKLAILVLIYNKLKTRTFNHMYLALHGDTFADPDGFQEINFVMATTGAISMFLADRTYKVRKNINFKHPEFKYGSVFEEFYTSLENR